MAAIEAIATTYLEAATATVTFSSLPQTYEHLQIRVSGRHTSSGGGGSSIYIRFNGDTTGYETHTMQGYNGNNTNTDRYADQGYVYAGGRITGPLTPKATNYGASVIDILDYRNTNKNTSITYIQGMNAVVGTDPNRVVFGEALWGSTAEITTLHFYTIGTGFSRGSSITVYGLNSS